MDGRLRSMTSVYFTDDTGVLCLYRIGSRVANNKYVGAAGGHFEQEEVSDARKCILREMREELDLVESDVKDMTLRYITYRLKNGEIRQNYYFFASLATNRKLQSTEGILRWVPYDDLLGLDMPISASHMMKHYLHTGRFDGRLYAGVTQETGTTFVPMEEFEG